MKNRTIGKLLAVVALSFLVLMGHADASVIISVPSVSGTPGSSGTFDVILQNTGPNSINIGAFAFGIGTTNAGITFSSATTATVLSYIFLGDSLFGPEIATATGTSLVASDIPASVSFVTIASGGSVGLGHISYSIASDASFGAFSITFNGPFTSLDDGTGTAVPFTTADGDITVTPEPGGMGLIGGLALAAFGLIKRKIRA